MFADDINLFISNSSIESLFETMNEELRKVVTCFKTDKISLNISKTRYFLFHSTRKRKDKLNILPTLHIDTRQSKENLSQSFLEYT